MSGENSLSNLSAVGDLVETLASIKTDLEALKGNVKAIKGDTRRSLDLINATSDSKEPELDLERVASCIEAAVTFLGNTACNMSTLCRTKILEDYNKDLLSFVEDQDEEFVKAAPMLFRSTFPKEAQKHLQQVETLRKAKGRQAVPSFQRAPCTVHGGGGGGQMKKPSSKTLSLCSRSRTAKGGLSKK